MGMMWIVLTGSWVWQDTRVGNMIFVNVSSRMKEYISCFSFCFFSSRRRHTIYCRDWSSDVCSSDLVDLERLRQTVEHPAFASVYSSPILPPTPIQASPEPVFVEPEPPRGMGAVFGGKKKHAEAVAAAQAEFAAVHQQWQQAAAAVPMQQPAQPAEHRPAQDARPANLAADRTPYDEDCAHRQ